MNRQNEENRTGTAARAAEHVRSSERGFTMIETAIALVVMMVVGLGAASLFFFAAQNNIGANDRELAMAVAQKRMEWLRSMPLDPTTTTTAYSYPGGGLKATSANGVSETTTNGGRPYQVVTTITDVDTDLDNTATSNAIPPTIKVITIRVTPLGAGPEFNQVTSVFGSVTLTTQRTLNRVGPHRS
ncbi:MAG TPA: prepilin-type N-terminal cleavage/methylation domain-containing protein [Pyrinomonadaceae bacterium]|nr:prepilin-type N-terminal cleavage/methylation domain-containing protein [Pyrinomonadaceae bacterium]